jgi:hypothetical protein
MAYITAGELAGERVAGLVEEDGDELERLEQERPQLQTKVPHINHCESRSPLSEPRGESYSQRERERERKWEGFGDREVVLTRRMTTVETPTAAMKILWSRVELEDSASSSVLARRREESET